MKKVMLSTLAVGGLMLTSMAVSNAAITYRLTPLPGGTTFAATTGTDLYTGVASAGTNYLARLDDTNATLANFVEPSSISYGNLVIDPTPGGVNDTWNPGTDAYFLFTLESSTDGGSTWGGPTYFQVNGTVSGSMSNSGASTNAAFTVDGYFASLDGSTVAYTDDLGIVSIPTPANRQGVLLTVPVGGIDTDVYVEFANSFPITGTLAEGGFVAAVVPEPGTMAMLLGMGVSGSLLALRRRARK